MALGSVLPPTIRITDPAITILVTIARRSGERDCQEVDSSYVLALPEALGTRELLDGGHVPAALITEPACCG
jgi:hypothetical protein